MKRSVAFGSSGWKCPLNFLIDDLLLSQFFIKYRNTFVGSLINNDAIFYDVLGDFCNYHPIKHRYACSYVDLLMKVSMTHTYARHLN